MPLPTGLRLAPLGYSSADRQDSHATHYAAHDAAADLAAAFAAARAACPGLLSASVPLDASLPSRLPSLISRLVTSLCALQAAGEEALRAGVSALPPLCDDWVAQCEAFPRALDATLAMTCHLWTGEAAGRLAAALVQADEYMRRSWAWSAEQVACLATPEQGSGGAGGGEVAIYPEASSAARRVVHGRDDASPRALTVDWLRTLDDRNGGGCRPALLRRCAARYAAASPSRTRKAHTLPARRTSRGDCEGHGPADRPLLALWHRLMCATEDLTDAPTPDAATALASSAAAAPRGHHTAAVDGDDYLHSPHHRSVTPVRRRPFALGDWAEHKVPCRVGRFSGG